MAPADIELRPHQKETVTAAVKVLRDHPRASVVAACGTGKTLIAARTTARVASRGRVLVLLPTLDLLSQTVRSWHTAGRKGLSVAVCSARQAIEHPSAGGLPMTTAPAELAALAPTEGPVTDFATYASLPTVVTAHHAHRLPAWDLIVVDEAHRTAGRLGKAWASIHHDDQVPAHRRLYLTATPPASGTPTPTTPTPPSPPWTTKPSSAPSPSASPSPTPSTSGSSPTTRCSSPSSRTPTSATGSPPDPAPEPTACAWPATKSPSCAPSATANCAVS
ncbi:DEAD/DEAH box helicase family protein [Streptomyces niveus]|uniref:DEAD/DEAH box helicase family protein n=1 Tax=Streptomyces niveus TaxID=193462 RepID=UPI0036663032